MAQELSLPVQDVQLLLAQKSGDAALLYLWLRNGRSGELPMSRERGRAALKELEQLGLYTQPQKQPAAEHRPAYSREDVEQMLQQRNFSNVLGETQRRLGRLLSTEEVKCLLGIYDYLRLPGEVIGILVTYCVQRSQARGCRMPGMRAIEKEAYAWADLGVDTVETAVAHMQSQMARLTKSGRICTVLQIGGRRLTAAEDKYVQQWITWGFPEESVAMAYEKTCLNTGALKWPYLHSILASWHEKGLLTPEQIREGDGGAKKPPSKKGSGKPDKDIVRSFLEED